MRYHRILLVCLAMAIQVDCRPAPPACYLARRSQPCIVEVDDPPCIACLKQSCCPEGNVCIIPNTRCFWQFACTVHREQDCEARFGKFGPRYEAINACKIAHCDAECTLEPTSTQ